MDSKLTPYQNKFIDDITSQENITLAHQIGAGKTINILVIEPQKEPYTMVIPTDYRAMQKVVGGHIEYVQLDDECHLYCNEDGKLQGLIGNRSMDNGDVICGTFFICAGDDEGNDLSLSDEQIEKYQDRFKNPEYFRQFHNYTTPFVEELANNKAHFLKQILGENYKEQTEPTSRMIRIGVAPQRNDMESLTKMLDLLDPQKDNSNCDDSEDFER